MEHENRPSQVAIPKELKVKNRQTVLTAFLRGEPLTAVEISEKTRISRQTVQKSIEHFLSNELLVPFGKGTSGSLGGKRPELYVLNPDLYFLAIQNREGGFVFSLTNLAGTVIRSGLCMHGDNKTPEDIYRALSNYAASFFTPEERAHLLGVCYSLGGVIDRKTGRIRYNLAYMTMPSEEDLDYNRLTEIFPTARYAIVENDARIAAFATLKEHADRFEDVQAITVFAGVGIAGGFFSDGKMIFGCHSLVGEIGHIVVDPGDAELCKCGNHGCLERLVSIQRLRSLLTRDPARYQKSALGGRAIESIEYTDVFEASGAGDALCREVSEYIAHWFAAALKSIFVTFDPQIVIFQGYFAFADEYFKQVLLEEVKKFLYYPSNHKLELVFDRRSWAEVETIGAVAALSTRILEDDSVFAG
ncbi:MAG: ROK family transcriptional regulator [Christensenella sp.]|nr:ROK family transcriptional regulator [Christensenella sp.]